MNLIRALVVFGLIFFKIKPAETPVYVDKWVIWNIGQGLWVTHVLSDECRHYDMGGEAGSFKTVKKRLILACGKKLNRLHLSHWDYDHYLNIPFAARTLPRLCWQSFPARTPAKKSVGQVLALRLPACPPKPSLRPESAVRRWRPPAEAKGNESSGVYLESAVLLPGDSPLRQERLWVPVLADGLSSVQVLILGHHGSRTSTGEPLLRRLPALRLAVASARYARYRHPHPQVRARLHAAHIPLLRTEDWGHIWFETR